MQEDLKYQIYSPTSVIGIFNNALRLPQTISLILLKGRYTQGQNKAYAGYYYDFLYSESDTTSISIRVSSILRSKLINAEVYTLKGFIEKSIRNSSIELRFVVEEIIQQEEKQISEEDLQRYELIQKKLDKGSLNLETLIRDKNLSNEKIKIANIYGHSAIVHRDFSEGLDVSSNHFQITDYTCIITSKTSIITQLREISNLNYDVIALVRGGGDRQSFDVFNDVELADEFINLIPLTITALGHTVDETLLDKLADKRFHLPHDYGASLHAIMDKLSNEKSNSRAILIEEVKKDVTKQFTEQVKTLEGQLKKKNEEFVSAQKTFKENVEKQTKTFNDQLKVRNEEVEKLKADLSKKHEEQVKTLTNQLTKKNDEFIEAQKTFKEQIKNQNKTFNDQLKVRNEEVEKLKADLSKKHEEQVKTLTNQLTKKNDEFIEVQKTFKEQIENQNKTFNNQLKVRNEEVDKLKKDLSEKHGQQIKTISEQLSKKNDEFLKLQENNQKELEIIHKNYQQQQTLRKKEMEDYKKEINGLHEKNIQFAIQQKTADLSAKLSSLEQELLRSKDENDQSSTNWLFIIIALTIGFFIAFFLLKLL